MGLGFLFVVEQANHGQWGLLPSAGGLWRILGVVQEGKRPGLEKILFKYDMGCVLEQYFCGQEKHRATVEICMD